jgi:nucleoside-diphosphate-sugar epimerase
MNDPCRQTTVLVAGSEGFIGRHVIQALRQLAPDSAIVRLDRHLASGIMIGRSYSRDLASIMTADLTRIMIECDVTAVVNCAGTTQSEFDALQTANVTTTRRLVEASAGARAGMVFCQIGSAAEYEMLPRPEKTREDTPARPKGDYGHSKLAASACVLSAARQGLMAGYVVRLFNPIGRGMPTTQLAGLVMDYLRRGSDGAVHVGSLDTFRDYVDVRDVSEAIVASLGVANEVRGEVVNIGSGAAHSTRHLVDEILAVAKRGAVIEDADRGSARSGWANWQEADISRAETLLRWTPRFSLEETIRHIVCELP